MSVNQCVIWGTSFKNPTNNYNYNRLTFLKELIAHSPPRELSLAGDSNIYTVYNPRAGGKYKAHYQQFLGKLHNGFSEEAKIRLSGWIAKENLKGNIPSLDSIMKDKNWLEKLPSIPDDPSEKANLLLTGLINLYPNMGKKISLNVNESEMSYQQSNPVPFLYALSYCNNADEFKFLIESLKESKDIKAVSYVGGGQFEMQVTTTGWKRAKQVNSSKTPNKNFNQVFIAMWLDSSMDKLEQNIRTAITNANYKPLRIDDKIHSNKIDDEILSEIDKSRLMICDLTSSAEDKPRASVYFEAGYTKGKGIPVIWTCSEKMKEAQAKSLYIRQYKCLFWDDNNMEKFVKELQEHIKQLTNNLKN